MANLVMAWISAALAIAWAAYYLLAIGGFTPEGVDPLVVGLFVLTGAAGGWFRPSALPPFVDRAIKPGMAVTAKRLRAARTVFVGSVGLFVLHVVWLGYALAVPDQSERLSAALLGFVCSLMMAFSINLSIQGAFGVRNVLLDAPPRDDR